MKYFVFVLSFLLLCSTNLFSGTPPTLDKKQVQKIERKLRRQERKAKRVQKLQSRLSKFLQKRMEKQKKHPEKKNKTKGIFNGFLWGLVFLGLIGLAFFATGGIQVLAIVLLSFAAVLFLVFFFTFGFSDFQMC